MGCSDSLPLSPPTTTAVGAHGARHQPPPPPPPPAPRTSSAADAARWSASLAAADAARLSWSPNSVFSRHTPRPVLLVRGVLPAAPSPQATARGTERDVAMHTPTVGGTTPKTPPISLLPSGSPTSRSVAVWLPLQPPPSPIWLATAPPSARSDCSAPPSAPPMVLAVVTRYVVRTYTTSADVVWGVAFDADESSSAAWLASGWPSRSEPQQPPEPVGGTPAAGVATAPIVPNVLGPAVAARTE
jgi:hypothetical protein